ncbi:pilus assembly FimT family protein [Roseateles koreensis]|uniref:Prepilin-type N-terminal cleavage/methylation domain-containing protein n=1 Tax=Roseateles koreensis TaxID=2987526 RepID=A0ABT5KNL1_9BURK|nr:hypothetical protein [Roseateles koreensis]MDC8784479.1 hypothetical protein [Roseateles koreensis]
MLAPLKSARPSGAGTNTGTGLTLVECLVAMGVLAITMAVAAPSFVDLLNRRRVQVVAANLSNDLAYARAESGLRPENVIVYFQQTSTVSCYTIAYGIGYGHCDCSKAPGSACSSHTSLQELRTEQLLSSTGVSFSPTGSWPAGARNRVAFQAPQMLPSVQNFGVNVVGRSSQLRVELNGMGRVHLCSPNGSFSGVPVCVS